MTAHAQPNGQSPPPGGGDGVCLLLSPGHPVAIQSNGEDRPRLATVLGVKPGDFIIVRSPFALPRHAGDSLPPVTVRLEEEGSIYTFESSVLMALKLPAPVMILSYPESCDIHCLRSHPRFKCLIPALVEGDGFVSQGQLHDISRGGCRVVAGIGGNGRSKGSLRAGDEVAVHLPMEGLRIEKLRALVKNLSQNDGKTALGLAFPDGDLAWKTLSGFVDRLRLAGDLRDKSRAEPPRMNPGAIPDSELRDAKASVAEGAQVSIRCREPIDLQFTGNHLYERSTVLGVDPGELVIAEMPVRSGLKSCPKQGMGLRARFEAHGSYYGFMTSVVRFITKPRPMVILSYPKKIEVLMRRRHPRISCILPARLTNEHLDSSGYVTDISLGGCRVLANLDNGEPIVNVMSGDKLDLLIPLDGLCIEKLPAQVQNLCFEEGRIAMGLTFSLPPKQSARLGGFLDKLELASR